MKLAYKEEIGGFAQLRHRSTFASSPGGSAPLIRLAGTAPTHEDEVGMGSQWALVLLALDAARRSSGRAWSSIGRCDKPAE